MRRTSIALAACCLSCASWMGCVSSKGEFAYQDGEQEESPSRLSDEVIPLQYDDVPDRPQPLLEIGNPFFSPGDLISGKQVPGGAVWQTSLLVYGTLRTGVAAVERDGRQSDWANRLDLFADLSLTRTERFFLALRPLDEEGDFTGRTFDPEADYVNEVLSEHTGQPLERIQLDTDRDRFMSGREAVDYGLIDSVLENRDRPVQD